MNVSEIENKKVKIAIEALQTGNESWYSCFIEKPKMTDDGNVVDFHSFFANALGKEKFLEIYNTGNNGTEVYGNFRAGQWGDFDVFFKFHENAEGKFDTLEIGQYKK